jgi:hypothetical protein
MSCEKYKAALIDNAANGAELAPALREHVAACPSCAAELAQQRSLFAAIDSGVRQTMNAPLPPALLHRFEAGLAQQNPPRSLSLSWLYATAALATTGAVIFFAVPHLRTHKPDFRVVAVTQSTQSPTAHRPEIMTAILQPATPQEIERDRRHHAKPAARPEPEVLVPPDERSALEHFMTGPHATNLAVTLVKRIPEQREQNVVPVVTPDIQIASLTVSPIRDTDLSTNSSTNR